MESKTRSDDSSTISKGYTNYTFVEHIAFDDKRYCSIYEDENTYDLKRQEGQKKLIKVKCSPYSSNGTLLLIESFKDVIDLFAPVGNNTGKNQVGSCALVLFYTKSCQGSATVAPHYNALSRKNMDIKIAAIDAMKHHSLNTKFGIVGLPTIVLFHQGRPILKFNYTSSTITNFIRFITKHTDIETNLTSGAYVTSDDFLGPLSNRVEKEFDMWLYVSWMFIIVCACYYFTKSKLFTQIIEVIKRNWRESEAQHEHT